MKPVEEHENTIRVKFDKIECLKKFNQNDKISMYTQAQSISQNRKCFEFYYRGGLFGDTSYPQFLKKKLLYTIKNRIKIHLSINFKRDQTKKRNELQKAVKYFKELKNGYYGKYSFFLGDITNVFDKKSSVTNTSQICMDFLNIVGDGIEEWRLSYDGLDITRTYTTTSRTVFFKKSKNWIEKDYDVSDEFDEAEVPALHIQDKHINSKMIY